MEARLIIDIRDIHHCKDVVVEVVLEDATDNIKRQIVAVSRERVANAGAERTEHDPSGKNHK